PASNSAHTARPYAGPAQARSRQDAGRAPNPAPPAAPYAQCTNSTRAGRRPTGRRWNARGAVRRSTDSGGVWETRPRARVSCRSPDIAIAPMTPRAVEPARSEPAAAPDPRASPAIASSSRLPVTPHHRAVVHTPHGGADEDRPCTNPRCLPDIELLAGYVR